MSKENLVNLQQQVENLIIAHSRLVAENNELNKRLAQMTQKHALLMDKKEDAYKKLKTILTQIKEGAL